MVVLNLLGPLLDIGPRPSIVINLTGPFIEILISTNHPAGKVDCRATSKAFSTNVVDFLTLELMLRDGFVSPVE
jgi:hypothetical protein